MLIIYSALKIGALLISIIMPLSGPRKRTKTNGTSSVDLSDWAVNINGELENNSGIKDGYYHI